MPPPPPHMLHMYSGYATTVFAYSCLFAESLSVMSLLARALGALNPRAVQCARTTTVASGKGNEKVRRKGDREGGGVH